MVFQTAFLIIEKGEPFEKGSSIKLISEETLLGRQWETNKPDISFSSPYISKRHAHINYVNNQFTLTDQSSKHGTAVNGSVIVPNHPYILGNGDQISLSKNEVIFIFNCSQSVSGETSEFVNSKSISPGTLHDSFSINQERREILIDGRQLYLSGKDIELLLLLHRNRCTAVSYNEIKIKIWPERLSSTAEGIPDVGTDEITALVYRLRKRLGKHGHRIITIPRFGYMLDL
ncbi:FHA domain-containing protein [Pelotomaculum propionicicum]|uniref:FHA domain-containing protein n=1 Tax=Pelotomaculum propionicicum TaxID=258475 RepID=UPI003B7CEAC0